MAKRRKSAPSSTPRKRTPKPETPHDGEHVTWMDRPNGLTPLEDSEDFDNLGLHHRWPMAMLMQDRDREDPAAVFVDSTRHKTPYAYQWQDHPPTWMDPHLFAEMAWKDPEVKRILESAYKANNPAAYKRLVPELSRVFDEQYLPYVIEQFEEVAAAFIAQWMLRCHAYRETDPNKPKKRTRRRRRRPVE